MRHTINKYRLDVSSESGAQIPTANKRTVAFFTQICIQGVYQVPITNNLPTPAFISHGLQLPDNHFIDQNRSTTITLPELLVVCHQDRVLRGGLRLNPALQPLPVANCVDPLDKDRQNIEGFSRLCLDVDRLTVSGRIFHLGDRDIAAQV